MSVFIFVLTGSGLKMKTSCTIRSDTVCEPLEGFYCSEFPGYDCFEAKKHRRCEPGEYISQREYLFGDECCPMCPIGNRVKTDCEEDKSTSCQPCTEGTFMNKMNGLKKCLSCRECGAGSGLKMKTSCTIRSDTVCEPLEGFYCSEFPGYDCVEAKKHRRCEPGEYISQKGTSSTDTVCSTCSDGTFSDGTFTSCQNHKQCESEDLLLLRAGTKTEDAQCGDIPSDWTGLIVGVVVVLLVLVLVALTAWCYRVKIKRFLNRSKNL
uniref:TNFR-Cys domain-containing protein n=1 Tax=Labrus bergylta TaxID=56723 RepID=A0A3Q3F7A6_9LABR